MDFEIIQLINKQLEKIDKVLEVKHNIIFNNDKINVLAGFYFNEFEISNTISSKIIKYIKPLEKYFNINHLIINKGMVLFQATLKGAEKKK